MVLDKAHPALPPVEIHEEPSLEAQSLEAEAVKALSETEYANLKSICVAIGKDGMTVEEACTLANIPHTQLIALAEKHPIIQKIITLKELEYKRSLIKALSAKARAGDDKIATWLLERRYPGEFASGKKKGGDADSPGDTGFGEVIAFIQEHGDSRGIIERRTAVVTLPQKSTGGNQLIKKLQGFLG